MASSVIKKKGLGALEQVSEVEYTAPQDGIYTLIGVANGQTGDMLIRVKVTSGTMVYQAGCRSSLGVNPSVTVAAHKGDILKPDYAYQCTLKAYFSPLE